jgi:hypothetical protein
MRPDTEADAPITGFGAPAWVARCNRAETPRHGAAEWQQPKGVDA